MKRRDDGIDVEGKSPGFWYYPADFDRDVQMLSLAAQGLWIRMMGWMHFCEHRGYLELPTGDPMNADDIAAKVGKAKKEVKHALSEMERIGLYSRDDRGCIFCRRMVKDTRISRVRREAAAARVSEAQRAKNGTFAGANAGAKVPAKQNHSGDLVDTPSPAKPEQNAVPSDSVSDSFSPKGITRLFPVDKSDCASGSMVSHKTVSHVGAFRLDEGFMQFKELGERYGFQCSEQEWSNAYKWGWCEIQMPERLDAIKGIEARLRANDSSLSGATPKNYLLDRMWHRKIQQPFQRAERTVPEPEYKDVSKEAAAWAAKQRALVKPQ